MRKRPVREDVRGVTVYGNDEGWEWRTARVHVFIQQGPNGDSKLPTLEELTPLVSPASKPRTRRNHLVVTWRPNKSTPRHERNQPGRRWRRHQQRPSVRCEPSCVRADIVGTPR